MAAIDLAAVRTAVENLLQDEDDFLDSDTADLDPNIAAALEEYSQAFPARQMHDFTGDGTTRAFNLTDNLSAWLDDFSSINQVEFPAGETPPEILRRSEWETFLGDPDDDGNIEAVLLLQQVPSSSEKVRVLYKGQHTIKDLNGATVTTLPAARCNAFYLLAASYCCLALARHLSKQSEPAVGQDMMNFTTKPQEWAARAKELRADYERTKGSMEASGTSVSINTTELTGMPGFTNELAKKRIP